MGGSLVWAVVGKVKCLNVKIVVMILIVGLHYVKNKEMPWPQYHDGQHWSNKIALSYGVQGIPTMFLIDKKGNLVDFDATTGLEVKVQKLLDK